MTKLKKFDIYDRSLEFAVRVAKLTDVLPKKQAALEYSKQAIRASASIGANIEEADGALTKKDFMNKIGIARREARESRHWLWLIKKTDLLDYSRYGKELNWQLGESEELLLILSSIINNTKKNN